MIVKFPLTANGKLDRAALLAKIQSGDRGNGIGEQGNEIEKRIAAIWTTYPATETISLLMRIFALSAAIHYPQWIWCLKSRKCSEWFFPQTSLQRR